VRRKSGEGVARNFLFRCYSRAKYGYPSIGKIPNAAFDREIAKRLWEVSEELTGIRYEI